MKVTRVPASRIRNYWGMNYYASKELGTKHRPNKDEVFVSDELNGRRYRQTVAHEKLEAYLMREKGMRYKDAHKVAERFDDRVK